MATLGTMKTRILDELQLDLTNFEEEVERAIFSATAFYDDGDFWFLDATPATFILSATTRYSLDTILPGRSDIKDITLHLTPGKPELIYRTPGEMRDLEYDEDYTGQPTYWTIDNNELLVLPLANRTYTAEAFYTLKRSMTASDSASGVWVNEAEELIRLHAEADVLENRLKDPAEAMQKMGRVAMVLKKLDEKTVIRRGTRRIKPCM